MKYSSGDVVKIKCNNIFKTDIINGVVTKVKRFHSNGEYNAKKNNQIIYVKLENGKNISVVDKEKKSFFKRYQVIDIINQ